jgi:signal transduction histidine kinase
MVSRIGKVSATSLLTATLRGLRRGALTSLPLRLFQMIRRSLRAKFITVIVSLQLVVMVAVTVVVDRHQRQAILEQTRLRALALATGLAAVSEGHLLGYNFAKLEQAVESVAANDADVAYAVAHLYDGTVAAFSGRDDLQGQKLDDPVSRRALQATAPLIQEISLPENTGPGYDVAVPVFAPHSPRKWGTIRVGFSLKRANAMIEQTRHDLLLLGLAAILGATSLAIFLAMRISKPIGRLVADVHELARGAYERPIRVEARDEIGYLAHAFEQMRVALQRHMTSLADEARRLEEANRRLQETQQQLIQHERLAALGKMAARVAHEVNNPLAIIKTALRIIRGQNRHGQPSTDDLQMIEEEINRIARIIQELLSVSRPAVSPDVVQVNAVLRSLEPLLTHALHEKQISLQLHLDASLPPVCIATDQLKQVILNLVRNAEDAMLHGGELVIRTAHRGGDVEIGLTDTGSGIPQEHLAHLFDPFFTTKAGGRGVGLGLSVSYGIVRGANGRIEVESEVGKGSTFRVYLPAVASAHGG